MSPTQSRLSASAGLVASLTVTAIELRLHSSGAFPPIDVWTAATCASSSVWLLRPSREARQAPRDRPGRLLSQRRTTRLLPLGAYDKDLIRCRYRSGVIDLIAQGTNRIGSRSRTRARRPRREPDGETMAMIYVDFAVCSIGVISSAVAAVLWFYVSRIKVPDNQDAFIGELQRISRLNARAAMAFGIAALCAAYIFFQFLELVPFLLGT